MSSAPISPVYFFRSLIKHHELITALTQREFQVRYRGSALGILWSFVQPLLMLTIYTFAFRVAFTAKSSWGTSTSDYALVLFIGLLIFNFVSECMLRAPSLIHNHASYVKKIVFPLEILPWVLASSAMTQLLVGFSIWFIFYAFIHGYPQPSAIFLPILLVPLTLLTVGVTLILSALGVYVRDLTHAMAALTTVLMFVSPVFYGADVLPASYQWIVSINPLAKIIEMARLILITGELPNPLALIKLTVICAFIAWAGYIGFQRVRSGFADVL